MLYKTYYQAPIGQLGLISDGKAITGLYLPNQQDFDQHFSSALVEKDLVLFNKAKSWLDGYFKGKNEEIDFPLKPEGTPFQKEVWEQLRSIPYGQTATYSTIAQTIARKRGIKKMAAQAVGSAVGKNPISILIPCHRVVGKNGSLIGYSGGLDTKVVLLDLERVDTSQFVLP
ncbi:methylated-DNA--[protein]-cysteine S-methyltransferase [Staphylococcus sp. SQ8-PEA]|uniref:Methylated-DNA--protein-cysteine methyltransferase n=1 Tax=Staphylococcus marylandisciuri TaxID=2981529 RepID=A0ABT2QN15_9STAP|nr:methylated-DNA--[protein]-cysteine S-methyltransferase [Staphylococcus marylandisciuri]MCU5745371.1 methylated-DNA--[protein]-cysteine S-methyltransferase [Staphylococcus marylandisciuri]